MIILKKLNGEKFMLNSELIETIMETPDTTILLTNGKHLIVRESKAPITIISLNGPASKKFDFVCTRLDAVR